MRDLPDHIWSEIYEYDGTKYDLNRKLVQEFHAVRALTEELSYLVCFSSHKLPNILKRVARRYKKAELKQCAHFLRVRLPRRITKYKILFSTFLSLCYFPNCWLRKRRLDLMTLA